MSGKCDQYIKKNGGQQEMIRVQNRKTFKGSGVYIGRPSPLGNPFLIGKDGTRDEVIEKYRFWLPKNLKSDTRIRREFQSIKKLSEEGDVNLICWCAPEKCHGDIIKELIEES